MTPIAATDSLGIIVLAAGSSRRFGSDKRQALMPDGQNLLSATLSRIPGTFHRRLLVMRPGDEALAESLAPDWPLLIAGSAHGGMGNSLAAALGEIIADVAWQGCLIALGDMPYIRADTYAAIQTALASHPIVVPMYAGRQGNPVGFSRDYFAELAVLSGDAGARRVLETHREACFRLNCGDEGIIRDVDEPGSLIT